MKLAACREIDVISARYGLLGPALRTSPGPYDPIVLAIGIDRQYHVPVRIGDEMREVERHRPRAVRISKGTLRSHAQIGVRDRVEGLTHHV